MSIQKYSLRSAGDQKKKTNYTKNLLKHLGVNFELSESIFSEMFIIEADADMIHRLKAKGYEIHKIVEKKKYI